MKEIFKEAARARQRFSIATRAKMAASQRRRYNKARTEGVVLS